MSFVEEIMLEEVYNDPEIQKILKANCELLCQQEEEKE